MSAVCENHNNVAAAVVVVVNGTHERAENGISGRAERRRTRDSESPAVRPINTIGVGVASDGKPFSVSLSPPRRLSLRFHGIRWSSRRVKLIMSWPD